MKHERLIIEKRPKMRAMTKTQDKCWNYVYSLMSTDEGMTFNTLCQHICDGLTRGEYTNLEAIDIMSYIEKYKAIPVFVDARYSLYSHLL